jgi:hypothetical protein
MIAPLSGFLERKYGDKPGPIVISKGLRNLYDYIKACEYALWDIVITPYLLGGQ